MVHLTQTPVSYVFAILALLIGALASVLPVRDTTVELPSGVTYDPKTKVWCTPTSWTDVASFFLGNYFTHAATVITYPGEPAIVVILNMILSILLPSCGAGRGFMAIIRHAAFHKGPIEQALRSGALCMVVRSPTWKPIPGEILRSLSFLPAKLREKNIEDFGAYGLLSEEKENIEQHVAELKSQNEPIEMRVETPLWLARDAAAARFEIVDPRYQVFGAYKMPEGYEMAYVPENAVIEPLDDSSDAPNRNTIPQSSYQLVSIYSFASALISVVQVLYAVSGLYRARGDQISKYGYAAYSFTVLPYVIMSVVNLLGNLVTPRYPNLYMIKTEMMEEAMQRGGKFEGMVGNIQRTPLEVDETLVFKAALKEVGQELWDMKIIKIFDQPGDVEPFSVEESEIVFNAQDQLKDHPDSATKGGTTLETVTEKEITNLSKASNDSSISREKEKEETQKPLLICPSCYPFLTKEEKQGRPLSLANPKQFNNVGKWLLRILRIILGALPLAINGAMSQFKVGQSTVAQRAWTMTWLAVGISIPVGTSLSITTIRNVGDFYTDLTRMLTGKTDVQVKKRFWGKLAERVAFIVCLALFAMPSIGGFVVVAQMLRESASCQLL